ncbi:hypothetical protein MXL84_12535 [Enterococcus gallinarum]|uniref:hypothetical protein n=1 Tax=Enterococcus gallinarum TaxID=1353 RepID=UPI002DBE8E1A|nr:hypothetical protein [Enterococcus gallinarum]MEB5882703.1 hypothetical protein [Enterococcus gallinarum]
MSKKQELKNYVVNSIVHNAFDPNELLRLINLLPDQPQLNENQQIVLEWLKEEQTKNPELTIFGTLSVLFDESENRFMNLDVIDALNDLSNSQQSGVFQAFSQWALEQEAE